MPNISFTAWASKPMVENARPLRTGRTPVTWFAKFDRAICSLDSEGERIARAELAKLGYLIRLDTEGGDE